MSAFMVEDDCINRIVSYFAECLQKGESWILSPLKDTGYIPDEKLAAAMFALNCESVNQRYGRGQAETFRPLDFKFIKVNEFDTMQVLKSLGCFLYQACEGNCNETPLYKALREIEGKIALKIVHNSPEYNKAEWV